MTKSTQRFYTFLGLIQSGDIANITTYVTHKRRRAVMFSKTWPKKPPSEEQAAQRQRFQDAITEWNQLTPQQKKQWERAAKTLSLGLTGYNAYLHLQLTPDPAALQTIRRQSRINLQQ